MSNIRHFLGSLLFIFCVAITGFAQSQATTGLIQGTVLDPNSAVINGATVKIENTDTGFNRTVTTNSDGFFSAPLLPLGKYRVTVTASGFADSILENVQLTVGQTLNIKIDMKVGTAADYGRRHRRGFGCRDKPYGAEYADRQHLGREPADQPARFQQIRTAYARGIDRSGAGWRRNHHQRPKGDPE